MKKTNYLIIALFLGIAFAACGDAVQKDKQQEQVVEVETTAEGEQIERESFQVVSEESKVNWFGELMGVYTHEGLINLSDGYLEFEGDQLVGGNFVVDMTTIAPTDENYSEENPQENLINHLQSDDFFLVEEHPTASFTINAMNGNNLEGLLTIRGISNDAVVENIVVNKEEGTAEGVLVFNRQDFDVAFTHPVKDMVISNDIKVGVLLKF